LLVSRIYGQDCNDHIKSEVENESTSFSFKKPLSLTGKNGKTQPFFVYAITMGNSIGLIFQASELKLCPETGDTIQFRFTDGTNLGLPNDLASNCDNKYALFFGKEHGNLSTLNLIYAKTISRITLCSPIEKVEGMFNNERAFSFRAALKCLAACTNPDSSQSVEKVIETSVAYAVVEHMPEFPRGYHQMLKFLKTHIRKPEGSEGTVYVQFVIEQDGTLTELKIIRSLSAAADAEALRVVSIMPKWNPGTQNGKPVRVKFVLPIRFQQLASKQ
jgi:TonB family protein